MFVIYTETHGRMQLARLKLAIRVKQKLVIKISPHFITYYTYSHSVEYSDSHYKSILCFTAHTVLAKQNKA